MSPPGMTLFWPSHLPQMNAGPCSKWGSWPHIFLRMEENFNDISEGIIQSTYGGTLDKDTMDYAKCDTARLWRRSRPFIGQRHNGLRRPTQPSKVSSSSAPSVVAYLNYPSIPHHLDVIIVWFYVTCPFPPNTMNFQCLIHG